MRFVVLSRFLLFSSSAAQFRSKQKKVNQRELRNVMESFLDSEYFNGTDSSDILRYLPPRRRRKDKDCQLIIQQPQQLDKDSGSLCSELVNRLFPSDANYSFGNEATTGSVPGYQ